MLFSEFSTTKSSNQNLRIICKVCIQFSLNIAVKYADTPTHAFFNIAILLYSSREPWVDLENPFPTPPNFAYLGIMLMPRLVSDLTPNRRFLEKSPLSTTATISSEAWNSF